MNKKTAIIIMICGLLISCKSVDLEKIYYKSEAEEKEKQNPPPEVKFVQTPETVYVATDDGVTTGTVPAPLSGSEAVKQDYKNKTVEPYYDSNHMKGWLYKEGVTYQIHCQTFHSTVIQLEPGEEMVEVPYVSEPDVWRIARGVRPDAKPVQYLIIKPDYSGLASTLVILTNRRMYLCELKSYKDNYQPLVKWIYDEPVMDTGSWAEWKAQKEAAAAQTARIEFPSHDYKIHYWFKKPVWCPTYVYDNGEKTFIVLDEKCLHTELPVLHNKSKALINYRVDKNTLIVDRLIEKVTLQLGHKKVTVEKKKASGSIEAKAAKAEKENLIKADEEQKLADKKAAAEKEEDDKKAVENTVIISAVSADALNNSSAGGQEQK